MEFSEYFSTLSPYLSMGKHRSFYFIELIGNFIKDGAMDSCEILKYKPDTHARYISGRRRLPWKHAQYLYDHRDLKKFSDWMWNRLDESDSYDNVVTWPEQLGITSNDPTETCAKLLENILLDIIKPADIPTSEVEKNIFPLKKIYYRSTFTFDNNRIIMNINSVDSSKRLSAQGIYKLTANYEFQTFFRHRSRVIQVSTTIDGLFIKGDTSINNWQSQSFMNNLVSAKTYNCTAIFIVISLMDVCTVQFLMIGE